MHGPTSLTCVLGITLVSELTFFMLNTVVSYGIVFQIAMLPSFDHIYPEINRGMCGHQRRFQGHELGLDPGIDDGNRIAESS